MLRVRNREDWLWIEGTVNGQRVRKSTRLRKGYEEAANRLRLQIERDLVEGRRLGPTVEDATREYIASRDVGVTARTYLARFARWKAKTRVADLDLAEIHQKLMNQTKARETIRREIGAVQAMLNWAAKTYQMSAQFNIQKPRQGEERLRFLDEKEVEAMVDASPLWFRPLLLALFYTGMRRSEAAKLTYGDIKDGSFIVATRKGRSGRTRWRNVPIHDKLKKLIGAGRSDEPVFTDEFGKSWARDVTRINKVWKTVAARAGVNDCVPHDARRTFASRLLKNGVDVRTIADLLGHTSLDKLMLYAQVVQTSKKSAVDALDF